MEEIADYLYEQHLSAPFVVAYLQNIKDWLERLLCEFPDSGTPTPEYGEGIRRVVYRKHSFLYRVI